MLYNIEENHEEKSHNRAMTCAVFQYESQAFCTPISIVVRASYMNVELQNEINHLPDLLLLLLFGFEWGFISPLFPLVYGTQNHSILIFAIFMM